jgi:hypothetical protein
MTITNAQQDLLPFHPLAKNFPLMNGSEFNELVADVKANNGLHEPITLYQGKILDGRNRHRACLKAKVEPGVDAVRALRAVLKVALRQFGMKCMSCEEIPATGDSPPESSGSLGDDLPF